MYNTVDLLVRKIKNQEVKLVKKGKISAVHDDDLIKFLKSIKEYERIEKGEIQCYFCQETINLDNIQSIFPVDKEVKYCCSSERCYCLLIEGSYTE